MIEPSPASSGATVEKLAYNVREAAQKISVSPGTIYNLLARGLLKSSDALRHKIIPHTEIERFLKETTK